MELRMTQQFGKSETLNELANAFRRKTTIKRFEHQVNLVKTGDEVENKADVDQDSKRQMEDSLPIVFSTLMRSTLFVTHAEEVEKEHRIAHRNDTPAARRVFDQEFGLVLRS